MAEDMTPIGDEVKEHLSRLQEQSSADERDIWTEEDQAKLEQEMAEIVSNPLYVNEDFPDIPVVINSERLTVHNVNNFPMILGVVDKLRRDQEPDEPFEKLFAHLAAERKYLEIFEALETRSPAAYKRVRLIDADRPPRQKTQEEQDEENYIKSQAYTAAADIARSLDPSYNLAHLTRT